MRIAVVGGGIAGLALGVALRRRARVGEVVVFEQDSAANLEVRQGHGMMLMENGVDALQALGAAHVLEGCTPLTRAVFREGHGVPIRTEALSSVYCTTRAALVEGLRRHLDPDVIRFERRCREVTLSESGLRVEAVRFADGASAVSDEFDLFVGAEGWRSPLCDALNPGFVRPTSPVLEIVTSTHLPDFARQLGGWFVKTVFPERGVALGLLAPTSDQVIGFLQFDSRRHAPPDPGASPDELRAAAYRCAGPWLERLISHLQRQRDYAVDRLNAMHGVRCHAPEGTYVLFPDISAHGLPAETLVDRLQRDHRVALVPGAPRFFGPGAEGHLRISFATSRAVLAEALDRLEAGLEPT